MIMLMIGGPSTGKGLGQWDTGRQIQIYPNNGGKVLEVFMSAGGTNDFAVPFTVGYGGSVTVKIPDFLLKSFGVLTVSTVEINENGVQYEQRMNFNIEKREKPEYYTEGDAGIITPNILVSSAGGPFCVSKQVKTAFGENPLIVAGNTETHMSFFGESIYPAAGEEYTLPYVSAVGHFKNSNEYGEVKYIQPVDWEVYPNESEMSDGSRWVTPSLKFTIPEPLEYDLEIVAYSNYKFTTSSM